MENNISELVERLGSDEDAVRKMAVFKLQSSIGDPSFADIFIAEGGLTRLRYLSLHASGNTLAYSLTSLARLLEVDKGWEFVDQEVVERTLALLDRRTYSNASFGQHSAWCNVYPGFHCITPSYR